MHANILWASFTIIPIDENKWNLIKNYRNGLLAQCDWTQLPDAVLTEAERTACQDYRQLLRDIPQDYLTPDDVIFPTTPAKI